MYDTFLAPPYSSVSCSQHKMRIKKSILKVCVSSWSGGGATVVVLGVSHIHASVRGFDSRDDAAWQMVDETFSRLFLNHTAGSGVPAPQLERGPQNTVKMERRKILFNIRAVHRRARTAGPNVKENTGDCQTPFKTMSTRFMR